MAESAGTHAVLQALDASLALLTVEEAARRLRIGRTTCFKLVRAGEIESVTVGRLRRVPPDALPAFVSELRRRTGNRLGGRA
ncbi:excisionase family DNA-binding protein [Streptomyces sp. NPDC000888]